MKQNLKNFLTVSEAARFLGVSASTLRNWDRMGKVSARRHPVNGYRLYVQAELSALLNGVSRRAGGESRRARLVRSRGRRRS